MWFEDSFKGLRVQIKILESVLDWISKQQLNLSLFLWDWYCPKLGLPDLPGHDGKETSDINFILSPYYRSFHAERDFLYEALLNTRLLWAKTWNNEYQSEYESVSRISIWINFHFVLTKSFSSTFHSSVLSRRNKECPKLYWGFFLSLLNIYDEVYLRKH